MENDKRWEQVEQLKKQKDELYAKYSDINKQIEDLVYEIQGDPPPFDVLDIYLRKDTEIVGLHAIGTADTPYQVQQLDGTVTQERGFLPIDQWGNEYDENFNMIGRGSFRVFSSVEDAAKELEQGGWVRFEKPIQKENK